MEILKRVMLLDLAAALALCLFWGARAEAQDRVNGPDQAIVIKLHQINQDAESLGKLGATRATNAQVQAFATMMVTEHRAADDKLLTYAADKNMNLDSIARSPARRRTGSTRRRTSSAAAPTRSTPPSSPRRSRITRLRSTSPIKGRGWPRIPRCAP